MALHPEVEGLLAFFAELGMPDPRSVTPEQLRESMGAMPVENPTPVGSIENQHVPGKDGDVPVRIYRPDGDGPFPLLMLFHGGGWVVGNLDSHDETGRLLCAGAEAVVVSVDYRLAPETPFPGGLEDCYNATVWAADNAALLGADAGRLAVAGDSAGGNLAAAVCMLARDRAGPAIKHQLLIYPVTDYNLETTSYLTNGEGYFLTRDMMGWFWEQYLQDAEQAVSPLASPLRGNLGNLPAATVITAEYDPLRDEGLAYAAALADAGVPVQSRDYAGMIHGFFSLTEALSEGRKAVAYACEQLRAGLRAA